VYALSAAFKNMTIKSGLFCERIGGVKLKSYSGSAAGPQLPALDAQPEERLAGIHAGGGGEIADSLLCGGEGRRGECRWLDGSVCDRPDGRIVPYLVLGATLSSKIIASSSLSPDMPIDTSVAISNRCFGSWRSSR
jgi:hypothetical protein